MMKLPPQVHTALELLGAAGFEGYLVGGAVRDYARGAEQAQDWDITTNALPQQVKGVFEAYQVIETGLKHGTVTVLLDGVPLEITTYRIDGTYTDHRRPDSVRFTGRLREDLERRDFTMNAMAYSPTRGIVDPWGGLADLDAGIIRCVGEPDRRFQEDALRILRGLRFAGRYGMEIEKETAAAMHRNRDLLTRVAAERVRVELTGLLCGPYAAGVLEEFADIIAVPLPEVAGMFGFVQHNPHHDKDVWAHTLAVVGAAPPVPELRWAALLHDIGKPQCFSMGEDGVGHFYGHAPRSTQMADEILRRLRFDTAGREEIVRLVRYHDMVLTPERKQLRRLLNKLGEEGLRRQIALHRADTLGLAPAVRERLGLLEEVEGALDALLREESCFSLKDLAVNGRDMMELGLRGREIGAALSRCLDAVLEERVPNERSGLLQIVKEEGR